MQTQKLRRHFRLVGRLTFTAMAFVLVTTVIAVPSSSFAQSNGSSHNDGSMDKNEPIFDIVLDTNIPSTGGPFEAAGQIFAPSTGGTTSGANPVGVAHVTGSVDDNGLARVQIFHDITMRGVLVAAGFLRLSGTPSANKTNSEEDKLAVLGGTDDFRHVTGELIVSQETNGTGSLTLHIEADLRRARLRTRDDGSTTGGTTSGTTSGTTTSGGTTSGTTSGGTTSGTSSGGTTSGGTTSGTTSGGTTSGTTSGDTTSGTTTSGGTTSGTTSGSTTSGGTTAGTTSGGTTSGDTTSGTTGGGTTSGTTSGDTTAGTTTSGETTSGTTSGGTTSGDTTSGTTSGGTTSGTTSGDTTSGGTTSGGTTSGTTSGTTTGTTGNSTEP